MRRVRSPVLRTRTHPAGQGRDLELPREPRHPQDTEPSPNLVLRKIQDEPVVDVLGQIRFGDAFA